MRHLFRWPAPTACLILFGVLVGLLAAPAGPSSASLSSRLSSQQSREHALSQAVASDNGHIAKLQGSISAVQARLAPIQASLDAKRAELVSIHNQLRTAQVRIVLLERRLRAADAALSRLLIAKYKSDTPDAVTVILNSRGFADLLERVDFIKRVRNEDANIISGDRRARTIVIAEATRLGALQVRQQRVAAAILLQRDQIDRIRLALVSREIAAEQARSVKSAKLAQARAARRQLQGELTHIHSAQASASAPAGAAPVTASGHVLSGGGFTFPMPAGAASPPGSWSQDQGVDISAPGGTPLLAVGSGTIVLHGIGGFGPSAPVLHLDDGRYVYYGHAGPGNMVSIGTHVSAGQTISEVGSGIVGISTGPHLEIGFSDASGTPAPGTSGTMLALLQSAHGG